ncbi:MAG TPA: nitrogen fixation protein NifZ [Rhodocyclaceae bacterium]|nr:nitrogen fixation protein NifZ [Rhodocyclaceae bacterium]
MIGQKWQLGEAVRVIRNVRDDGTYPGAATGELLVRRGSVGHVVDVGTFLMDQIIYSVHFLDSGRIVGCREEELIGGDEPWVPSRFEFREKVRSARALAVGGEVRVPVDGVGQIMEILRDAENGVAYHVHFDCRPGILYRVPEAFLLPLAA